MSGISIRQSWSYLLYGTTVLKELWLPSNEDFFIYFNISYIYFLLEVEWWVISPSPYEPIRWELRYYLDVNTPIKFCSEAYFFQAPGSLTSLKSQTLDSWLKIPPGGLGLRIFTSWKKSIDLSQVWSHEPWISSIVPRDHQGLQHSL